MDQVRFGPFELDLASGQLRRGGTQVKLQPQPTRLLTLLVSHSGELLTRDEIRARLWDADTFVDFDQSVNFCVRQIRAALHDDADKPCYVETVPRRGYRFVAPVQRAAAEANASFETGAALPAARTDVSRWRTVPRRWMLAAALLVIAVLSSFAAGAIRSRAKAPTARTGVAAWTRPVDAHVREQVLLGRFFLSKGHREDITRAIDLFESAISSDADCAPAYAGLADAYNHLGSVFVAGKPPASARLLALRAAIRATQLDPEIAEAYEALGYTNLHELDWQQASDALQRALRLNPGYAPAHATYASYLVAQGRRSEAVDEARRALALDPVSLGTRHTLAWMLYFNHEYDAAIAELRTTLQMDPSYSFGRWRLGQVALVAGRIDEAVGELERAAVDGHRAPAILGLLAMGYARQGRTAEVRRVLDDLQARSGTETVPPGAIALAQIAAGDAPKAIAALEEVFATRDNYAIYIAVDPLLDQLRSEPRFQSLSEQVVRGVTRASARAGREPDVVAPHTVPLDDATVPAATR